jgi:hypothetical protein
LSGSGAPRRITESGSRTAPEAPIFSAETRPKAAGAFTLLIAGMMGGAIVSGILVSAGSVLPAFLIPRAPQILSGLVHGENLPLVILMIVLGGVAGILSGIARPPAGSLEGGEAAAPAGVSFFRFAVAAGLMGLIAGVTTSLLQGGFDLFVTLDWMVSMAIAGILSASIASLLARK